MSKLHVLVIKSFSFRRAHPLICVITRNRNNQFILREKTWLILKHRELEIELECYVYKRVHLCEHMISA